MGVLSIERRVKKYKIEPYSGSIQYIRDKNNKG
jgi:hypothetical protein